MVNEQSKEPRLLNDPRFAKMFQDEDFAIDEASEAFRLLNPSTIVQPGEKPSRKLTAVEEEILDEVPNSSNTDSDDEHASEPEKLEDARGERDRLSTPSYKRSKRRNPQPQMRVVPSTKTQSQKDRSFGSRRMTPKKEKLRFKSIGGEREITFAPERKSKAKVVVAEGPRVRRNDNTRRSASGNVFRNM